MRDCQSAHMMDTCVIYPFESWNYDGRGSKDGKTFGTPVTVNCGLEILSDKQKNYQGANYETIEIDAIARLALDVDIKPNDEVEITRRFGESVPVKRYEVIKFAASGASGQRIYLKAVLA